jgi:hypothetical protein
MNTTQEAREAAAALAARWKEEVRLLDVKGDQMHGLPDARKIYAQAAAIDDCRRELYAAFGLDESGAPAGAQNAPSEITVPPR